MISSEVARQGNLREALHEDSPTSRPLSEGYENVGMAGEFAFGEFSGLYPDVELKKSGDSGVDFTIPLMFTVDVKTARRAYNLIHEAGKSFADIYVLAEFDDKSGSASLLGWEWGHVLAQAPTKDFGYGVINHYIPREKLRPMSQLEARLASIRRML